MNCKLIIGLGNPDEKYRNTYHNVGHLIVNYLKKSPDSIRQPAEYILNSTTYMNKSGQFVAKALKKYNTKPQELLVIHDDADLELGKYKLSSGRGSAGHKGVENIIQTLKTKNFWRLRIGIRKKMDLPADFVGPKRLPRLKVKTERVKAEKIVLKKISSRDKKILEEVFQTIKNSIFSQ